MKLIILILLSISALNANVYYSKIEPLEVRKISSNVLGIVVFINENLIGQKLSLKPYIKIDASLDIDELESVENKLKYLKNTVTLNKNIILNLDDLLDKKSKNYEKIKNLKIKSILEKDREFYDLILSKNTYLSTKKDINALNTQIADLEFRYKQLVRTISDKNLVSEGLTLYSIDVKIGQVVNKATPLATVMNMSKAILTVYISQEELLTAKNSMIYIDGKKTSYRINRLLNIADSKNISKYKAQIIIKAPKIFSKLVKVEFRAKLSD